MAPAVVACQAPAGPTGTLRRAVAPIPRLQPLSHRRARSTPGSSGWSSGGASPVRGRSCAAAAPDVGASAAPAPALGVHWVQKTITLPNHARGCHVITRKVYEAVPELATFEVGLANIFILHTSASLTINENASPDVPLDLNDALNRLAPEGGMYRHSDEGPDDMPAHVKSSLMGPGLTLPISKGRFALGTWQGIYLNEHRNHGGPRSLVITIQGQQRQDGRKYAPAWHA